MIIYYLQFRLEKAQKHTQQQKNVVAGKNLPYVLLEATYGLLHVPLEVIYEALHMYLWKQHMEHSIIQLWSQYYHVQLHII